MSVIVKGMIIPNNCSSCCFNKLHIDAVSCYLLEDAIIGESYWTFYEKRKDCPLIEVPDNHGDLIDRDKLKRKAQKVATEAWKMKISANVETTLNQFIDWIDDAPTIIEGSEE